MRNVLRIAVTISLPILSYSGLHAQAEVQGSNYVLTIESTIPDQDSIAFTGLYSISGTSSEPEVVEVIATTPYADTLSGTVFLGIFTSTPKGTKLHVQLHQEVNGTVRSVDGVGDLSVLRGGPDVIGYGWPDPKGGFGHPSDPADK